MPDIPERKVIDGEPEVTRDELVEAIERNRARWEALVARADDRANEPGVAGDWTLRDVVAHINYYLRFHVENLGGPARGFGEMPQEIGFDMEKRNQWMHERDKDLSWEFVRAEAKEITDELLRQLRRRSDEDMRAQFAPWHHWPVWRWECDVRNHYNEHITGLEAWLEANPR
jgi:hypothetical protein